jgi:hypothetical protein
VWGSRDYGTLAGGRSQKLNQTAEARHAGGLPGFPSGMPSTHADQINADILEFIKK